jgi:hypothetical protein
MATKTSHRRKAPLKNRDPMARELEKPIYQQKRIPNSKKKDQKGFRILEDWEECNYD